MAADLTRTLSRLRGILATTLELTGAAAITYGAGIIYRPAALLIGGAFLIVASLALDRGSR